MKSPIDINKMWMNALRKNVQDVTFVSFENTMGEYFVHIKVKNEFGGRDVVRYKLEEGLTPETMRSIDWEHIYKNLKSRGYEHN